MKTIEKLENGKLEGGDASLETSLIEYGLAWQKESESVNFVYGIRVNESFEFIEFETCRIMEEDFKSDFDWISEEDWDGLFSFIGSDKAAFNEMPLEHRISSLLSYFGTENIFGGYYGEALTLEEVAEKFSA